MSTLFRRRRVLVSVIAIVAASATAAVLHAQSRFDIFLLAFDSKGYAVTDLELKDLQFRENDKSGTVVSVDRFQWPIKVTVLVDNGRGGAAGVGTGLTSDNQAAVASAASVQSVAPDCSFNNLVHYRNGLKKLFETLPSDVEVTLIATAPNPRYLIKPTADPVQIQKGVNLLTPDSEFTGRFTDSLTEYAQRLDIEFKQLTREERPPYQPVLVVIGSTTLDGSRIERERAIRMLTSMQRYGVLTNFIMIAPCSVSNDIDEGGTVLIAKAVQEATRGRYEPIASGGTTRLVTLLPEIGAKIAARHRKQMLQYRLTLERPEGATGPFGKSEISLSRPGVQYIMSLDGTYP